ncbi:MAG: hypothetical protein ACLU4Q_03400 [Streptococcus thermophilus]
MIESMVLTILDGLIGLGFAALVVGTIGDAMDLKETVSLGVAMGRIGFSPQRLIPKESCRQIRHQNSILSKLLDMIRKDLLNLWIFRGFMMFKKDREKSKKVVFFS